VCAGSDTDSISPSAFELWRIISMPASMVGPLITYD
jgi:hypothetical protein